MRYQGEFISNNERKKAYLNPLELKVIKVLEDKKLYYLIDYNCIDYFNKGLFLSFYLPDDKIAIEFSIDKNDIARNKLIKLKKRLCKEHKINFLIINHIGKIEKTVDTFINKFKNE